nr:rhomboid family intramembrane serine protease [Pseudenhygromyxa sp. WMMC2535]
MALLGLGALSEDLLLAGGVSAWARVVTSAWIHVDLVSLLFDVYAIWMAGQLVERLLGPARMILVSVGAALIGLLASVLALPWLWESGLEVLAVVPATSGTLMAIGTTTAGLCCLLPSRTPGLSSRARRNLGITFSLLLFANMLLGWPGLPGVGVAPVALLVCVLVASAAAILPVGMQGPGQWLIRGLAGLLLALSVFAGGVVASAQGEDPQAYLAEHRMQRCRFDEVVVDTPFHFTPMVFNEQGYDRQVPFELPALEGLVDELELRSGGLVQLAVMHDPSPGVAAEMATDAVGASEGSPALLDAVGILDRELERSAPGTLPVPLAAAIAADDTGSWQAHDLWRNGERAGRLIERRIPAAAGEGAYVVVLLAAPAEALEHAPSLYAAMLGDVSVDLQAEQTQADGAFVRPHCTVE